jgi:hypothetical protein
MVRLSVAKRKVPKTTCGFKPVLSIVASNSHWQWTENPLPAVIGVLLAWAVTWAIMTVRDRIGR